MGNEENPLEYTRREEDYDEARGKRYKPSLERTLPNSPECEKGIICSIFRDPVAAMKCVITYGITSAHFFHTAHAILFREIEWLSQQGALAVRPYPGGPLQADIPMLLKRLRDIGELENAGGDVYILNLNEYVPTAANAERYCAGLREKFFLRETIRLDTETTKDAYDSQDDPEAILKSVQVKAARLAEILRPRHAKKTNAQILDEIIESVESNNREKLFGKPTGIKSLDTEIFGAMASDLIVIAGGTSSGKSALAGQIELFWARTHGQRVLDFTFEMSEEQKLKRLLQLTSGVNLKRHLTDQMELGKTSTDRDDLKNSAEDLKRIPIEFFHDKALYGSIRDVANECRRQHAQSPIGLVTIDFDALIKGERQRGDTKEEELNSIAYGAKGIATELHCVVILLSQVTVDRRDGHVKTRGSEAKLHAANVAFYIEEAEQSDRRIVKVWKQRDGARGKEITMGFRGETGYFYEVDDEAEPAQPPKGKIPPRRK